MEVVLQTMMDAVLGGGNGSQQAATVITIAHRLATVLQCDNVLLMDDGHALEYGKPRELLEVGGGASGPGGGEEGPGPQGAFAQLVKESGLDAQALMQQADDRAKASI